MNAQTLQTKTKTHRPSSHPNRVARPSYQACTFAEINGDLAEEMRIALSGSKMEADTHPCVEAEDFEAVTLWFYS